MRVANMLAFVVLVAALSLATGASDEVLKIGIVDLDQALSSTEEGKKAREEFKRKRREAEAKVQPLIERFQTLQEEIKSKRFVLSEEALFEKQLDLAELQNQIQNKVEEMKGQLQVDKTRIEGPLINKLSEIVAELGRDHGFTIILERNSPMVLYAREALDVTDQIIEKFNEKS